MPTSFTFTETKVRALKPPADGRDREYHKDSQCRGLKLRHRDRGQDVLPRPPAQRATHPPTAGQDGPAIRTGARRAAARHAGDMAAGGNPQADRRQKRHEMTMGQLI